MGWFEEQIRQRRTYDYADVASAVDEITSSVTGHRAPRALNADEQIEDALARVLAYYGAKPAGNMRNQYANIEDMLTEQLSGTGVMFRQVKLPKKWHRDAVGALLGLTTDGLPIALIPKNTVRGGYSYRDQQTGKSATVTDDTVGTVIQENAYCFYRPFPAKKMGVADLLRYMLGTLDKRDFAIVFISMLVVTAVGMGLPILNNYLFDTVVASGSMRLVLAIGVMVLSLSLTQILIGSIQSVFMNNVNIKLTSQVQAAAMMRLLNLPASFFKDYQVGDLTTRFNSVSTVAVILEQMVVGQGITALFGLIYIAQMLAYAPSLFLPALIITLLAIIMSFAMNMLNLRRNRKMLLASAELTGWENTLINSIQKLKLAKAEVRAFKAWSSRFAQKATAQYGHPGPAVLEGPAQALIYGLGLLVIYLVAMNSGVSLAQYMAFSVAYGMVTAAFTSLANALQQIVMLRPHLEMVQPIFEVVPESSEGKPRPARVGGSITFENVNFAYNKSQKPLFEGLDLTIKAGEYVGIVGKTGCGKSTIMRLILGFEKPQVGAVYIGGRDISTIDMPSVRRSMGVVLQNGTVFSGSIFNNIAISTPGLTLDEAWQAAEMAGIAQDIREMPMGMQTMLSPDGGGVSGGQLQRIMIARAIASKPRILLFDEATSALDNITQSQVVQSLAGLKCTRVVVAHRLSTVEQCDRILVVDDGKIAEEGSYADLMAKRGLFYELVKRQEV